MDEKKIVSISVLLISILRGVLILLLFTVLFFCKRKEKQLLNNKYNVIVKTLNQVDSLLKVDGGYFWNKNLKGPILFVNRKTREFVANENDSQQTFEKEGSLFKGVLPKEVNISNTDLYWKQKHWTMIMLPLPKDKYARNNLVIHELFHRIQDEIGFENLSESDNSHLDTYYGRVLLKLELEALKVALKTSNKESAKEHIMNALKFREIRQESNAIKFAENSLELNEGLTEYTALRLSGRNDTQIKRHLLSSIDNYKNVKTFVRSFAYQTIPAYGYLLSKYKKNWHRKVNSKTNISDIFRSHLALKAPKRISLNDVKNLEVYSYQSIKKVELHRENERIANIKKYKKMFIDNATLKIVFESMNISFNPNNLIPLEDFGTVYPTLRITDNWGILDVEKGALLSSDWKSVKVTLPLVITDNQIKGNGWELELKKSWKLSKSKKGYELKKQ